MRMLTPDGTEVMQLDRIERSGNGILLRVVVMGSMPMAIVLSPEEARKGVRLLTFRLVLFLVTFLFRTSAKKPGPASA